MLKRKLDPSTDAPDFSIRSCPKDLRLRRIISPGSDSKGIKFTENGGPDIGSCEASGGKDPIMDKDLIKGLDKVDRFCDSVQVFLFFENKFQYLVFVFTSFGGLSFVIWRSMHIQASYCFILVQSNQINKE